MTDRVRDTIIRVLIEHPGGLGFRELREAVDALEPDLKSSSLLVPLLDMIRHGKLIEQMPIRPLPSRHVYRLPVDCWVLAAQNLQMRGRHG